MNGSQTLAEFLRTLLSGMVSNDTEAASLECTIPFAGGTAIVSFDVTLTGVQPLPGESAQGDSNG